MKFELPAVAVTVFALALCGSAQAATISYDGNVLVYSGDPVTNYVLMYPAGDGSANVDISDWTEIAAPGCEALDTDLVRCPIPAGVRMDLGDGKDTASFSDLQLSQRVEVNGGAGDDDLRDSSRGAVDVFSGGPGNDVIKGFEGNDSLDGGDGDDDVDGGIGSDTVLGGAGTDIVAGDGYADPGVDVIDGGPGIDTIDHDWINYDSSALVTPLNITLAGGADDGRGSGGEGDDVRNVERIDLNMAGTYIGTDAAEDFKSREVLEPITMRGNGGDDNLKSADGDDTVDGGAGADTIDAGYGDDTIVGGPGRDKILADTMSGDCSYLWCKMPYGNDHVDVRDGEIDSVVCGAGADVVEADPGDVVAPDCETVNRGAGKGSDPSPVTTTPRVATLAAKIASTKLRDARSRGLLVKVTVPAAGSLKLTVKRGSSVVGRTSRRVSKAGTVSLRVKPTKAARRLKGKVKLTVSATFTPTGGKPQSAKAARSLR